MVRINIESLSYRDLVKLQSEIEIAIASRKAEEAKALKAQLAALAEKNGFTVDELFGGRRKVLRAVKYRNPKNPNETWTGRGRKPIWLVTAMKRGAKLESFAV